MDSATKNPNNSFLTDPFMDKLPFSSSLTHPETNVLTESHLVAILLIAIYLVAFLGGVMATLSSAQKRHKQSLVRRMRNRQEKSAIATAVRAYREALEAKDKELAQAKLVSAIKLMDTAAGKGTFHKNTVARKKSRMHRAFNAQNWS